MKIDSKHLKTAAFIGFIILAATMRIIPHAPNVAPITALALLGGAYLSLPWLVIAPLVAMLVSDSIIGFDALPITLSIYLSFAVIALTGLWLRKKRNAYKIITASLAGSTIFYLVTNAAVWRFSGMYPLTFDGLILSYYYAIPFFRNTISGDMIFVASTFLAVQYAPSLVRSFGKVPVPETKKISSTKNF